MSSLSAKRSALLANIAAHGSCAVAYSGGVDSAVVAKAAYEALGDNAVAITRDALIYEGDATRVWAVRDDDKAIELRRIRVGLTNGKMVEVREGLAPKDRVITKGSLFIDRVAAGG